MKHASIQICTKNKQDPFDSYVFYWPGPCSISTSFKIYIMLVGVAYILLKQNYQRTNFTINTLIMLFNISLKVLYFDSRSLLLAVLTGNTLQ